jgi:Domain of unknown function (DUF4124)
MRSVLNAVLVVAAGSLIISAQAQTLYRDVDKDGKVTYSDEPLGKRGKTTTLEIDKNLNITESPKRYSDGKKSDFDERIKKREALRDKLRADLEEAQARFAAAEMALANGRDPRDEELQSTISYADNNGKPNAAGILTGRNGRVVCSKEKNPDGSERIVCPAVSVPNEEYPKRVKELEDAVARAEEEVRRAEQAYRRDGPD